MKHFLSISLKIVDDMIRVSMNVDYKKNIDEVKFILNKNLKVLSATCDAYQCKWLVSKTFQPEFRSPVNEIVVSANCDNNGNFQIEYEGEVTGWLNTIEKDKILLSFYSVWYPQNLLPEIDNIIVKIDSLSDYIVIKGDYDTNSGTWTYGKKNFDICNIIALKKNRVKFINRGRSTVYWFDETEDYDANIMSQCFEDVLNYYSNELYSHVEIDQFDIVSMSDKDSSGAYLRNGLIVCAKFDFLNDSSISKEVEINYLFGHELAHIWCTGADTETWEDWLNETTAEWSAIIYAIDNELPEIVDICLKKRINQKNIYPAIKTKDGSRPSGVHDSGTLLFYEIYKKYGKETVIELCKTFVNLKKKTTEEFIKAVKKNISSEISDFLLSELVKERNTSIIENDF